MTDEKALATTEQNWLAPITTVQNMIAVYNQMADFVRDALREGVDYGRIPGTLKDTLYKPGGEKLARFFGLSPSFIDLDIIEDWTGIDHDGEPFFYYRQKCELYRNGVLIANAQGSCNSWEKRYRYRQQKQICPTCKNETIIKGKEEYGGGWICWKRNGGCGSKFLDGDVTIEDQKTGQVKNPDIHDQVNTILKIAQKRSFVASVLLAVNGSEYFTQDVEDISFGSGSTIVEGEVKETKMTKTIAKKQTKPANGDRPLTPEALQARLGQLATQAEENNWTPGEYDANMVAANLEKCWAGEKESKDKRKTVMNFLVTVTSVKDLTGPQVIAFKKWLHAQPIDDGSGEWMPDEMAVKEARACYTEALKAEGQHEMELTNNGEVPK